MGGTDTTQRRMASGVELGELEVVRRFDSVQSPAPLTGIVAGSGRRWIRRSRQPVNHYRVSKRNAFSPLGPKPASFRRACRIPGSLAFIQASRSACFQLRPWRSAKAFRAASSSVVSDLGFISSSNEYKDNLPKRFCQVNNRQKKRQEVELAQAKRDTELTVREGNLAADTKRFEEQLKFNTERFTTMEKYLKEMMTDILGRLPNVNMDITKKVTR